MYISLFWIKLYLLFLSGAIATVLIILFFYHSTKKKVPNNSLSEDEIQSITEYGLLHFTSSKYLNSILSDGTIRFGKRKIYHYFGQRYLTWYFLCTHEVDIPYIRETHKKMLKMQTNIDVCIHITGITNDRLSNFLINPKTNHIVHIGNLKMPMKFYILINNDWKEMQ